MGGRQAAFKEHRAGFKGDFVYVPYYARNQQKGMVRVRPGPTRRAKDELRVVLMSNG